MKNILGIVFIAMVAVACNPQQKQEVDYKVVRDEVMKFHDVVMADHGVIVNNQMKLDTLLKDLKGLKSKFPELDTLKEKEAISALVVDLTKAEDSMNDWMHKFEPDVTGKSNEAAVKYFEEEKVKIAAVDSLYKKEIGLSNAYLEKLKK
jgi:GTPase involved in cell partitioning and DNA repair